MYIWKILGIEPTTDIGEIKKAFAKKAKNYHPEEFPEEYKNLRNAYKQAIEYAKQKEKVKAENSVPKTEDSESDKTGEQKQESKEKEVLFSFDAVIPEKPVIEKPSTENLHLEIEKKDRIEIPKLKESFLEKPVLEKPKMEVPHLEDSGPQKPSVNKIPPETPKLEIPRLKELMKQEPPVVEIPVLQFPSDDDPAPKDPMLKKIEKRMMQRAKFQQVNRDPEFSFDEVENALSPEAIEEFLYYFRGIACNPILRDSIECWTMYLEREEFREIYSRDDVCKSIIDILGKSFWGKRDTLLYFIYFLGVKSGQKFEETQGLYWWFKKFIGILPRIEAEKNLTNDELAVHNTILAEFRKKKITYDLVHFEIARQEYLDQYFDIIKDDHKEWKRRWQENQKERMGKNILNLLRLALIPVAIYLVFVFLWMLIKMLFQI